MSGLVGLLWWANKQCQVLRWRLEKRWWQQRSLRLLTMHNDIMNFPQSRSEWSERSRERKPGCVWLTFHSVKSKMKQISKLVVEITSVLCWSFFTIWVIYLYYNARNNNKRKHTKRNTPGFLWSVGQLSHKLLLYKRFCILRDVLDKEE